ncbi:hypothetical protein N658DRAFT_205932 [Parathielavia hyrcaniae]|uniref:Cell cycle control protein n=1 Tax=Parathielavia hyrcaniae TaxID=113614 RepID=A0AAN6SZT7_9PEZI|nr:hypothetical protein N658DRAFT_205932 [Parathielavia hyrcaniae]
MDFHDPYPLIDLAGLPSDAFESDFDFGQARSDDYSSWPAESSPQPFDGEDESEQEARDDDIGEEDDAEEDEEGGEEEDEVEEEAEAEEEDSSDLEIENDHSAQDPEESGQESQHEHEDFEAEDENELEYISDDDGELHEVWRAADGWQSEPESEAGNFDGGQRSMSEILEDYENHRADDMFSDESLFVDQAHHNLLPPIQTLLASVRQNHARALNLLHSELRRQDRAFERASAGPSRENHRQNNRHHPYDLPQERRRMADRRDHRSSSLFGDELVAVEMRAPPRRNRTPLRAQPEVIDLTGEPDSAEEAAVILPPPPRRGASSVQAAERHPRRHLSLGQRTPSLSRSDGSLLRNNPNVIDLTLDDSSPAPPPMPQQLPRREIPENNHHHHRQNQHHPHRRPHRRPEEPSGLLARFNGIIRGINQYRLGGRAPEVEVQLIGGRPNMADPLGGNVPILNYRGNGHNAGGAPKPDHVPPPPAREGFTRDTGSTDDVVVCAGCEQELKYDPDLANDNAMSPRATKKPRTRKDQEEHYFWALKECGHVYCKNCYESRSSRTTRNPPPSVFRRDKANKKMYCKVDGCETSDVNVKTSWVGLFV